MKMKKRFLGILLSLVMVLGLMPEMSLTALADNQIAYTFTPNNVMCLLGNIDCTKITKIDALVDMENIVDGGWGQVKWQNTNNEGPAQSIEGTPGIRKYTVEHETIPDAAYAIVQIVGSARLLGFVVYAGDNVLNSGGTMDIPELTVPQAITGLKESGSDQALVTAGTAAAGSIEYSLDNNTWSTDVPKAKDKGDYTVYYRLKYGDNNSQTYTSLHGAKGIPVTIDEVEQYPLWVGGTQVTSANAGNIDGNNKASYDAASRTLTLNGYSYTGVGYKMGSTDEACAAIYWSDSDNPLTIQLSGTNSIVRTGTSGIKYGDSAYYGIYSPGDIIIKGPATASLSIDGGATESPSYGIFAHATIQDVQVTASGTSTGISRLSAIQRANVTATGGSYGIFQLHPRNKREQHCYGYGRYKRD